MYGRSLPRCVGPLDWYAFDLAAAMKLHDIRELAELLDDEGAGAQRKRLHQPLQTNVYDDGNSFVLRGTEIPPWER